MAKRSLPSVGTPLRAVGLRLLGDERLARRAVAGDRRAFEVIYARHHEAIYRFCRSLLGNPEDAADALQSTMVAALASLPGERRTIKLKPWLYRIAHNESVSLLRQRSEVQVGEPPERTAPGADSELVERERIRLLVADLRQLPDRQKGALVMRELAGSSYEEIAAMLATSPTAAKQCVYEARTALHELAEGRAMSCEAIRRTISERDGRRLRSRGLRAHLRACAECRNFQALLRARRSELKTLAPAPPAGVAASLLPGILGGGGSGAGTASGSLGLVASATAKLGGTSAAVKGAAAGTLAVIAGGGTVELIDRGDLGPPKSTEIEARKTSGSDGEARPRVLSSRSRPTPSGAAPKRRDAGPTRRPASAEARGSRRPTFARPPHGYPPDRPDPPAGHPPDRPDPSDPAPGAPPPSVAGALEAPPVAGP